MFRFESPVSPSRRVAELLADRLHEPWSIDRLSQVLGLSSRTLHRVVQRELGVSPMQLLRRVRLAQARADLEAAQADTSVTRVAYDCGFTHLGRFSGDYARQYGESPSHTLRRGQQRRLDSESALAEPASTAA